MELYWLLILPRVHELCCFVAFFCIPALILNIIARCVIESDDEFRQSREKILPRLQIGTKWILSLMIICSLGKCLTPDKTDLAIMLGWDAVRSESAQEVFELLKDKLKD